MRPLKNNKYKHMKIIGSILILFIGFTSFSQIHDPVKWTTNVEEISDTEYELSAIAKIEDSARQVNRKANQRKKGFLKRILGSWSSAS